MSYELDFKPATPRDRDAAIKWFRSQGRAVQRLIKRANDPNYTPMCTEFRVVLEHVLERYHESIERLDKLKFRKGARP